MIQVTRTFVRPDVSIPWHHHQILTPEVSTTMKKYNDNNFCLFKNIDESQDGLKMTINMIFSDRASWDTYVNDSILSDFWDKRDAYNELNGIIKQDLEIIDI